jgi:hypothetical protein
MGDERAEAESTKAKDVENVREKSEVGSHCSEIQILLKSLTMAVRTENLYICF